MCLRFWWLPWCGGFVGSVPAIVSTITGTPVSLGLAVKVEVAFLIAFPTGLFGYSSMGTADPGCDEVFNDVEQFFGRYLMLSDCFGMSIDDKTQETSLVPSLPEVSNGTFVG
ncbi:hypothetical protein Pyn_10525 [Prunus yedoensis var. nudiflora]|uniref:Uncharacterized protein n=1 Tax=Prunus yedoensis var. nudiflora TaxID=2094558 RepID=A0A314UCW5_PRUYE|nr:hypothetical protein Pyn_10525 [Prunus yedoensis var. nudiflora]